MNSINELKQQAVAHYGTRICLQCRYMMDPLVDAINGCQYVDLREINEPDQNELRLVIFEMKADQIVPVEELPEILKSLGPGLRRVDSDSSCQAFEITWSDYIAYAVRNESYALAEPSGSIGQGRLFAEYSKSVYLEYLSKATLALEDASYLGPSKHYAIHCVNHVVDVVSTVEPSIKLLHPVLHSNPRAS